MFRLSSIDCKLSSTADLLSYILYFGHLRAKIFFLSFEKLLWNNFNPVLGVFCKYFFILQAQIREQMSGPEI